jgi:mycothiol system anti-sigma-R factor
VSCGRHHEIDCAEVLAQMWLYLDDECECERRDKLRQHLEECGPCLPRFGLEGHLKEVLARKCGGEHAPETLRKRLHDSIRTVVLEQTKVTVQRDDSTTSVETTVDVRHISTEYREL